MERARERERERERVRESGGRGGRREREKERERDGEVEVVSLISNSGRSKFCLCRLHRNFSSGTQAHAGYKALQS